MSLKKQKQTVHHGMERVSGGIAMVASDSGHALTLGHHSDYPGAQRHDLWRPPLHPLIPVQSHVLIARISLEESPRDSAGWV